jgi:predicted outer membrane repeat protein
MYRTALRLAAIIALGFISLGEAHRVSAENQVVNDCGDSGLPTQLRFKLQIAQELDNITITFTCATPIVLIDGVLPSIYLNVTIDGGNTITLSGNNASRLFEVESGGNLTLKGITLTKGYAAGDGGAIASYGTLNITNSKFLNNATSSNGNGGAIVSFGTLNITNSEFADNIAANGGALYPTGGNAVTTIVGSQFHDNATTSTTNGWGGAIYMSAGASVTIDSSILGTNQAQIGGAVLLYAASTKLTVTNSVLNQNYASVGGGGLDIGYQTAATLTNVTISSNQSGHNGGGISNAGTLTLTNATLNRNQATQWGGGLYNYDGPAMLTNVTLSDNSATPDGAGGGIFNLDVVTLINVTLSGNTAGDGGGIFNSSSGGINVQNTLVAKGASGSSCYGLSLGGGFNLSDDTSCTGNKAVNLLLGPLVNNSGPTLTHMPQAGSPAIDGGGGAGCPATDQRGASRPIGLACDVGAVEYGAILPWLYLPLIRR